MKTLYYIILVGLSIQWTYALPPAGSIPSDSVSYKMGDSVFIHIPINPAQFHLSSQGMVTIYPVIRSYDRTREHIFEGIVLSGKNVIKF